MDGPIPKPWEFHPMLVHFPIAFLIGGVAVELFALRRPGEMLHRAAAWLLLADNGHWLSSESSGDHDHD